MRTWLYIDGFNFYYGLKNPKKLPIGLAGCNFRTLAERFFVRHGDVLEKIRYFTSPVSRSHAITSGEDIRQEIWLRAVQTIPGLDITEGLHMRERHRTHTKNIHLRERHVTRKEKMTDVNIAVELILDGFNVHGYEKALILSGDLDLFPAAFAVASRLSQSKEVEFWIPPDTPAGLLRQRCGWSGLPCSLVTPEMLYRSRFTDEIMHEGQKITYDSRWKLPKDIKKNYAWARVDHDA